MIDHSCWQRHVMSAHCVLAFVAVCFLFAPAVSAHVGDPAAPPSPADMEQWMAAAGKVNPPWEGPRSGPAGVSGKTIAMVCEDLRNAGILGVALGIREAAGVLQWQVKVFDAGGTPAGRDRAMAGVLVLAPDGLILVGTDARSMAPRLRPLADRGVPMVGWHVGPKAGPMVDNPVAMNISTDPLEVARIAASSAVMASGGRAGVVIFTDSNFEIAMAKADAMADVIRACKGCRLLEMRDVAISQSAQQMPEVTRELLARHGKRWTYALAINDIYFDYAVPELIKAGEAARGICFLSAGDGSPAAFMRIQAGTFQTATVAEPLNVHGWQLVDELNRLLAHRPVSGYITPVHLVTPRNVKYDGGPHLQYDPDNGYRDIYRHIWKR
ncbi:MAG: substrate-binding domain-containing protein [Desulfobacteraceae bacterium]